ncbi:MAG TPA: DUF3089 domain-containing protein [Candidatus Angelobacter sp.]|nr:DUF3089 domain-containing protein [Candidatus Angelobacter sp.]
MTSHLQRFAIVLSLSATFVAGAAAQAATQQDPAKPPAVTPAKNDYSNADTWLCRPGRQDACAIDLSTTVIAADGKLTRETFAANPNAPIDCFYVYPTVSNDPGGNSDMVPGPEEMAAVRGQFARFASQCRPYAPIYRQITLTALRAGIGGKPIPVDQQLAYNDVLDAWNYYLQHDNHGRGVVLVGHSQGSGILIHLIRNEIDGKPVQAHIVSALLLGATLPVPKGKDVGGTFQHMPLCRSAAQTGCVITYVSFRAIVPPPANTYFGRVTDASMTAACTNPAALGGGSGELHAYFSTSGSLVRGASREPQPWVTPKSTADTPPAIATPFVSVPGMLTAECVSNEQESYLAVTIHADPAGPRTTDIPGDVVIAGQVHTEWGLHLIDVSMAMGNLVDIVRQQAKAYVPAEKKQR